MYGAMIWELLHVHTYGGSRVKKWILAHLPADHSKRRHNSYLQPPAESHHRQLDNVSISMCILRITDFSLYDTYVRMAVFYSLKICTNFHSSLQNFNSTPTIISHFKTWGYIIMCVSTDVGNSNLKFEI